MTVSTKFPLIVSSLITNLGAAASLSGVRVFDGSEVDLSYPKDWIAIGHDGSFDSSFMQIGSVSNTPFAFTDLHSEEGSINCVVTAQDGTTKFSGLRTRAFALLSAIDTVIRADTTFGGNGFYSILGTYSVNQLQTDMGAAVQIDFSISYQAQS
jgi:hypothetical protein